MQSILSQTLRSLILVVDFCTIFYTLGSVVWTCCHIGRKLNCIQETTRVGPYYW